jgi:hypothetical protein
MSTTRRHQLVMQPQGTTLRATRELAAPVVEMTCHRPTGTPTPEHFHVCIQVSGGYDGPTLSPLQIERALLVTALEADVPIDSIRVLARR